MGDFQLVGPPQSKPITKRFKQWKPYPKGGNFPLKWSLWADDISRRATQAGMSKEQFSSALEKRGDFGTMDQLCRLWNENTDERGLPAPDTSLFIFVEGIVPVWEDPANRFGGHYVCNIQKNEKKAEQLWYSLLMTVVCGQFPGRYYHEINGVVIAPRKQNGYRIYVWNKHSLNEKYLNNMRSFLVDSLDTPPAWVRYNTHKHKVFINKARSNKKKKGSNNSSQSPEPKDDTKESDDQEEEEEDEEEEEGEGEEQREDEDEFAESNDNEQDRQIIEENEDSPRTADETLSVAPETKSAISPFSVSVGLAIFLALMYNIYILMA